MIKQNVDFGGGLERIAAAAINSPDVFKISLLWPIIEKLEELSGKKYDKYVEEMRVIADHLRGAMFLDSFSDSYKDNFTYKGKRALFDYLEQLSEDLGEDIELDTVALCCEYSEYENLKELQGNYSDIETMEDLENKTQVIRIEDSEAFIIQSY